MWYLPFSGRTESRIHDWRKDMKILFISLGCDKNLVDTEVMLGLLASRGYEMTDDEAQADIIIDRKSVV